MFWSKKICNKEIVMDNLIEKLSKELVDPVNRKKLQTYGRWADQYNHQLIGFVLAQNRDILIIGRGSLTFRRDHLENKGEYVEEKISLTEKQEAKVKELFDFIVVGQATEIVDYSLRSDVSS